MNKIYELNDDKLTNGSNELSKFIISESVTKEISNELDKNDLENEEQQEQPNLQGDRANVALLTFLYFMQGIVSGLSAAMPLLLQNYGATYTQQAGI